MPIPTRGMGAAAPQPLEHVPVRGRLEGFVAFVERESILALFALLYAAALLVRLPATLGTDSWLTFVSGRLIREHGLPHADTLTIWSHGAAWVDQQWLAQLVFEACTRLGGVKLALLLHWALLAGGLALAVLAARRLGGGARMVTFVALLASPQLAEAWELRTQSFAYALFVAVVWLLVRDSRRRGRRVLICLPLLALWTNLHGSVLIGAAFVAVRGAVRLWRDRRDRTALALLVLPWLAVFASPYFAGLPSYYEHVLVGRGFSTLVVEWQPATPSFMTAFFYMLGFGVVAFLARAWARTNWLERIILLTTLGAGMMSLRNMVWFSLAALVVAPRLLEETLGRRTQDDAGRTIRVGLPVVAAFVTVVIALFVVTRSESWYTSAYAPDVADRVALTAKAHPKLPVFADLTLADWLLWRHPELAGRIEYDARLELLTRKQLLQLFHWRAHVGAGWRDIGGCPAIVVADPLQNPSTVPALVAGRGVRTVYRSSAAAIVVRISRAC